MHFEYLFTYKCETAGHFNVGHVLTESGITKKQQYSTKYHQFVKKE